MLRATKPRRIVQKACRYTLIAKNPFRLSVPKVRFLLATLTHAPVVYYRILSKNSSPTVARKIRHLVTIRIGMSKMAEGDEYLDYHDETLERRRNLGAFR